MGRRTWNSGRVVIRHEHIPGQLLQPPCEGRRALDLAIKGVAHSRLHPGGDSVAEGLEEMGYEVPARQRGPVPKLAGLGTVVIGVLPITCATVTVAPASLLFAYVGRRDSRRPVQPADRASDEPPRPIRPAAGSDARVTDENATVTFLAFRPRRAHDTQQDRRGRHGEVGAGARHVHYDAMGLAFHANRGVRRGRNTAEGGPARGEARRALRLHGTRVLRQLPAGSGAYRNLRQLVCSANDHPRGRSSRLPGPARRADELLDGATGLPWPRTWPAVYAVVLICFVAWVVLPGRPRRSFS